jgi:hypothetical protein
LFNIFKKNLKNWQASAITIAVAIRIVKDNLNNEAYLLYAEKIINDELEIFSMNHDKAYKINNDEGLSISKAALFLARNYTDEVTSEYEYKKHFHEERKQGIKSTPGHTTRNRREKLDSIISDQLLIFKD